MSGQAPRRVLILTPYWPPVNRVGLWRPLRVSRYLNEFGWTPVICTPQPKEIFHYLPLKDESLSIPDFLIYRPSTLIPSMRLSRGVGQLSDQLGLPQNVTALINKMSNRFIKGALLPDQFVEWGAEVALQIRRGLAPELKGINCVWATGGPFGNLIAGALIASALKCPLALDYRDPWTTHRPPRPRLFDAPQWALRTLEAWVLGRARGVSLINEETYTSLKAAFGRPRGAYWSVVPNGFDPLDLGDEEERSTSIPNLLYAGNLYQSRSLMPVIEAIERLDDRAPQVRVEVFGQIDRRAQEYLDEHPLPAHRFRQYGRVGAREIGARLRGARALLLVIGSDYKPALSAKIFDYLAAGRPIIGIGPRGAAAQTLIETHRLGRWIDEEHIEELSEVLLDIAHDRLPRPIAEDVSSLHARRMSEQIATLLDHVVT